MTLHYVMQIDGTPFADASRPLKLARLAGSIVDPAATHPDERVVPEDGLDPEEGGRAT